MGVDIPSSYDIDVTSIPPVTVSKVGPVGPVTVQGIPDTFHIHVRELPVLRIDVQRIPKIQLGLDPVDLSVRLKEFPEIRGHLPADFTVGLSMLGMELLSVRLCGEAQVITEPYVPNPCERCGHPGQAGEHRPVG